jgi:pimeloyl-ACP methyl ester carboxylesterase
MVTRRAMVIMCACQCVAAFHIHGSFLPQRASRRHLVLKPPSSAATTRASPGSWRSAADEVAVTPPASVTRTGGESKYWEGRHNSKVHYTSAGVQGVPVLLLTGFGVGGFHYERNVEVLAASGFRVFTMDILGQGKSWPSSDPAPGGGFHEPGFQWGFGPEADALCDASNLTYSCSLWEEQIVEFIETVVRLGPVYIAGNSLGGYLAVMVASRRPDLVKGLFLMNATPFWGVGVQRILPWTGGYPVPRWVRPLTIRWWDTIRSPTTIRQILGGVYANKERVGDALISQIIEPTEAPAAASAFASILCSPSSPRPFKDMLRDIRENKTPIAMAYGAEDPWIVPVWGFRAKRSIPDARYWEVSPAGHCPHHEAPEAINMLLQHWLAATEAGDRASLDAFAPKIVARDPAYGGSSDGGFRIVEVDGRPRSFSEYVDGFVYRVLGDE